MATLQFKRGSTATLMNYATPPAAGEPIWDKELCKLKVGDGETLYPNLPYVGEFEVQVDGKSIVYTNDDLLTLFGFENAQTNQVPAKGVDGSLVWITVASQDVIDAINDRINYVDDKVDAVDARVDEIFSDVFGADGIEGRLDTLEESVGQLNPERIEEALEAVEQYEDRLDDLHADVGQLKEDVEAIEGKDNEQDDRLDAIEENMPNLANDIFVIYGGSAYDCLIDDHAAEETEPEEEP